VRLRGAGHASAHLPLDEPVAVRQVLADCVELQAVATRRQIAVLAGLTRCPRTRTALQALSAGDDAAAARYQAEVLAPRLSLLDLLDRYPAIEATLADLLALWPALAPRHYSISSSPLADAATCSLTVAVVDAPALSGNGRYRGVCSTLLQAATPGTVLLGVVKPPAAGFHLPDDPLRPIIMVGPGTGLAPFRGFLQQRACLVAQGVALGEAWLFFGCRHPEQDFLYADELQAWAAQGLVRLELAFSRHGEQKVYVQDRMRAHAAALGRLLQAGAVVYVCGDGTRMEPAVRQCLGEMLQAQGEGAEGVARLVRAQRYVLDVWAGG
jgi:cytochrome P450/NADPH-cytochrome P450 reductase